MNAVEKRKETGAVRRAVGLVKLGVAGGLAALVLTVLFARKWAARPEDVTVPAPTPIAAPGTLFVKPEPRWEWAPER